jgi:hypothetical protein
MNLSQPGHAEFARLPKRAREAAYQKVRARVGPSGVATVSEMLFVATEM